jgi:endonuclease G
VRALAVILPHSIGEGSSVKQFLVSVDEVEQATGLDFFSLMDDQAEEAMESAARSRLW